MLLFLVDAMPKTDGGGERRRSPERAASTSRCNTPSPLAATSCGCRPRGKKRTLEPATATRLRLVMRRTAATAAARRRRSSRRIPSEERDEAARWRGWFESSRQARASLGLNPSPASAPTRTKVARGQAADFADTRAAAAALAAAELSAASGRRGAGRPAGAPCGLHAGGGRGRRGGGGAAEEEAEGAPEPSTSPTPAPTLTRDPDP